MTTDVNRALLIGTVKAHERRGDVLTLSLGTRKRWTDPRGEQEATEWHRVVWPCAGKKAEETLAQLTEGVRLYVEGEIQYRDVRDAEGSKRWVSEIKASRVEVL